MKMLIRPNIINSNCCLRTLNFIKDDRKLFYLIIVFITTVKYYVQ